LHAVFADGNLEHGLPQEMCRLVVNEEATKSGVLEALGMTIADAQTPRPAVVTVR